MSLISTYQSRKSLFAEKLITKGVEASATDGLTTLINKIDDIQSFTEGLLLYADKKIAQSEDTVNLYALLLEDNVAVSGEKVKIYSDIYLRSETCSSTDSLYDDYYVSSSKSGGVQYDFIGSNNDTYIRYNSTTINIFYGDHWSSDFGYTGEFHIKDGVLTYKDSQGVSHTVDVSMVDTTKVPSNPITVHYKWVEVTTGSDGVASYEYACTGSGLREFYATYSSIVSETYSILDCYRYDEGLLAEGHHNDIWAGNTNMLTREAEYSTLKESNVGTTATITVTGIPLTDYRIECDVYQVDGTQDEWFITVLDENYTSIRSADSKLGEWKHISLDLTNIASNSRVRLNTGGTCTELRFKNFKLYPI